MASFSSLENSNDRDILPSIGGLPPVSLVRLLHSRNVQQSSAVTNPRHD